MELGRQVPRSSALSERSGLDQKETKNGFPVMSAIDYGRLYDTDVREAGQDAILTFNYRGYVRFDAPDYEPGVYYKDSLATNGLLKDHDQRGIHVGTDGIVDYDALSENHRMRGPEDVREYDIYIEIPGKLQRKMSIVCRNDECFSLEEALQRGYDVEDIEEIWNSDRGWIVMRTHLEPAADPFARAKAQLIHESIVKFIERGGELTMIESFVKRLEAVIEGADPQEIAKRLGKTVEEISSVPQAKSATDKYGTSQISERASESTMRLNEQMLDVLRRKFNEYRTRLKVAEQEDVAYMAPEVREAIDFDLRDALYKAYIVGRLIGGQADREEIESRLKAQRPDFNTAQFDNAWKVIDAYNRNDLTRIRGGSGV